PLPPDTYALSLHDALPILPDLGALRAMHGRLQGEDVTHVAPIWHGNALSVYFRDPEGNRLEIFLDTPWYVRQPQRIPMDLRLPEDRKSTRLNSSHSQTSYA